MNIQDKVVLAHKGYFDKKSEKQYRENSRELCKISTAKNYVDIIELDVRKSKDGILYCYHGGFLQYWFGFIIPLNFTSLKKRYDVDSLQDILSVITEDKMIFLDLKNRSITRENILNSLKDKNFKEIILGKTGLFSVFFLDRFTDMPGNTVKIMNGNIFCHWYDLQKLKTKNYKYFEVVFPFQINKTLVEKARKAGLEFRSSGLFFWNSKAYWNKINTYDIQHVSSDFL